MSTRLFADRLGFNSAAPKSFARRLALLPLAVAAVAALSVADEGMWLFNNPPTEQLKERYGFEPGAEWMEHLQKSAVRFNNGGSGSVVSSSGLVMTNHHVARGILQKLSSAERDLLAEGFLARTPAEELPAQDLELDILWSIEDVTERVNAGVEGLDAAEAEKARRAARTTIEQERSESTGLVCETVTLYQGGRYHLYGYKRFTDVRLVMAPDSAAAAFGGDVDNFEYPRWCLDATFFRIYEDGAPLAPEHYLRWSPAGSGAGDLVFVAGHPGRTQRLDTVAALEYQRDVRMPLVLNFLWRNEVKLLNFSDRSAEQKRIAAGDLLGIQNGRKAYTGMMAGLHDPQLMEQKRKAEATLRAAVEADPEMKAKWGSAWDEIRAAQDVRRELYSRSLGAGTTGLQTSSTLYGHAVDIVRLASELSKPSAERLREYRDTGLDTRYLHLYSPAPIYDVLEIEHMANGMSLMAEMFGGDDPQVQRALGGMSPRARAAHCVTGTALGDVEERKRLVEGGADAVAASEDPMIVLARSLEGAGRELRKRLEDEAGSVETAGYAKIAAAKFAIEGEGVYPDATFTLRLAFGTVDGWTEDGRDIPPYTSVEGLYTRREERGAVEPFALQEPWMAAESKLDLATPYNFTCTTDIIGGNSGSPVVNRAGEVVGLIFDGNLHSLVYNFAYTDEVARSVAVDSRGMLEALGVVYGAAELVEELTRDTQLR
jgi:hypothetical protein